MRRFFFLMILAGLAAACSDEPTTSPLAPDGVRSSIAQNADAPVVNDLGDVLAGDVGYDGCDVGTCTLREAIAFADPGATITFTVTGGIELSDQLVIDKNLTLQGPGAASLTVGRPIGDYYRVFSVVAGVTAEISGLTISHGFTTFGGGIRNEGTLTLRECVVSENRGEDGGGILNDGGTLTLVNTSVTGNAALYEINAGGGIFNDQGVLTLQGSTVSDNGADSGGGILSSGGALTILNSTITRNSGGQAGGGLMLGNTVATVRESAIFENAADYGGGILVGGSDLLLEQSTVSGNYALHDGGGIFTLGVPEEVGVADPKTTILNSTVSGNQALDWDASGAGHGGGIYNGGGLISVALSTITANSAAAAGGGIYSAGGEAHLGEDEFVGPADTDLKGTILWGNTGEADAPDDLAALNTTTDNTFTSLDHNLFGTAGVNVTLAAFVLANDLTGIADAGLGALDDNGGPTLTHALLAGSPGIDTGTCTDADGTTVATDQRGETRPSPASGACDIGAFELVQASTNVAPVVTAIQLPTDPVALGASASLSATFTDANTADVHTAAIDWGEGTSDGSVAEADGTVTGSHTYAAPGVYAPMVTVSDAALSGSRSSILDVPAYIVVYDPSAGFVTGGGWILSPEGACLFAACTESTTGKASFGFVSRYQRGKSVPQGSTEFQFKAGDLNFKSAAYDWLVIAGARALFKGTGPINGTGDYGFLLAAIDGALPGGGDADKFRIKIWDRLDGDRVVYDNEMGEDDDTEPTTVLGGGSIHIQKK
jgi:hypothetical protein